MRLDSCALRAWATAVACGVSVQATRSSGETHYFLARYAERGQDIRHWPVAQKPGVCRQHNRLVQVLRGATRQEGFKWQELSGPGRGVHPLARLNICQASLRGVRMLPMVSIIHTSYLPGPKTPGSLSRFGRPAPAPKSRVHTQKARPLTFYGTTWQNTQLPDHMWNSAKARKHAVTLDSWREWRLVRSNFGGFR